MRAQPVVLHGEPSGRRRRGRGGCARGRGRRRPTTRCRSVGGSVAALEDRAADHAAPEVDLEARRRRARRRAVDRAVPPRDPLGRRDRIPHSATGARYVRTTVTVCSVSSPVSARMKGVRVHRSSLRPRCSSVSSASRRLVQKPAARRPTTSPRPSARPRASRSAGILGRAAREAGVAQHPQVVGDGGLADAELRADDVGQCARRLVALREQFDEPPADRIAEDVERVHATFISASTDINNG